MPEIILGDDIRPYVKNIAFDVDAYTEYLRDDRGMKESDIDNLSIIFTNEGLSSFAIANASPGFLTDGNHVIRISPRRLPLDIHKQGKVLRHETEHIIQGLSWQYKAWVAGQMSLIAASTIASGAAFAHEISESLEGISVAEPARIALSSVGAIGGAAIGMVVGARIGVSLSPLEIGATIAEYKYANRLADGTMVVSR